MLCRVFVFSTVLLLSMLLMSSNVETTSGRGVMRAVTTLRHSRICFFSPLLLRVLASHHLVFVLVAPEMTGLGSSSLGLDAWVLANGGGG